MVPATSRPWPALTGGPPSPRSPPAPRPATRPEAGPGAGRPGDRPGQRLVRRVGRVADPALIVEQPAQPERPGPPGQPREPRRDRQREGGAGGEQHRGERRVGEAERVPGAYSAPPPAAACRPPHAYTRTSHSGQCAAGSGSPGSRYTVSAAAPTRTAVTLACLTSQMWPHPAPPRIGLRAASRTAFISPRDYIAWGRNFPGTRCPPGSLPFVISTTRW
jgi:hypothetical protein